jgi:hypothetical protein
MRSLPKVTFVIDDFTAGSPGQQLLDRFLIGYNRDGQFYSPGCQVELLAARKDNDAVVARAKEFGLKIAQDLEQAQATVIFGNAADHLQKLPREARCFVYGTVVDDSTKANQLTALAKERGIALRGGTAVTGAFQLPVLKTPEGARLKLAVTHGKFPEADLEAVEALWILAKTSAPNPTVRLLKGDAVWALAYSAEWTELFAAGFSRSNTIQGDPVKDGRTQDVAGLRLVEKLVKEPRAWLIDEASSSTPRGTSVSKTAVFVMNGALEDLNVAFQDAGGKVVSTQLYRPPPPMQDHFSELAGQIEDFFRRDTAPEPGPALLQLPAMFEAMRGAMRDADLRGSRAPGFSR